MNRSYSKLRHIQEVNKLIEKRLIMEVEGDPIMIDNPMDGLEKELGIKIDSELANEVESCTIDEIGSGFNLNPDAKELLDKVRFKVKEFVNAKNKEGLKSFWSELKQKLKNRPETTSQAETTEQAGLVATVTIAGISAPMLVWVAIAAIAFTLIISGIFKIIKRMPRKKTTGKGCHRKTTIYNYRR